MKVNVRANNGQSVRVTVSAYDKLTPRSAIAAANIGFGQASHCDVSARIDGGFKQYRVTGTGDKRRARKIR
jgi:hypothetical protein